MPFLHEASVALQLVNLNAAHLLLAHRRNLFVLVVKTSCDSRLALLLGIEFLNVSFHVQLFLGLIESVDSGLEELVLDPVILFFGDSNFLCGLVVSKLACLGQHGNVCGRVNLLQSHLELVEDAQGNATLPLHNLVDHLGVELNVQIAQRGLQLFKVLQAVRDGVPAKFKNVTTVLRERLLD